MLVLLQPTDKRLIHFHRASKGHLLIHPRLPNPVCQIPGSALRDTKQLAKLDARQPFRVRGEQVEGQRPGLEAKVRVVQERSGTHGEVFAAGPAAIGLGVTRRAGLDVGRFAGRAADPIRPALCDKSGFGRGVVGELEEEGSHAERGVHAPKGSLVVPLAHDPGQEHAQQSTPALAGSAARCAPRPVVRRKLCLAVSSSSPSSSSFLTRL